MRPLALLLLAIPAALSAQAASLTYRLGKDTLAIEQYVRSNSGITGEMVQRSGPAVARYAYAVTVGKDGKPSTATLKRMQADGSAPAGTPSEYRYQFTTDSVIRETVFADSVQRRAFPAHGALINWPTFIYGPTELMASLRAKEAVDSMPAIGPAGSVGFTGLAALGGDSVRLKGVGYAMVLRFDGSQRLQSVDGSGTTNKVLAARGKGGLDIPGIAKSMKPTGVLSLREDARAAFGPGGMVVVDYGRPQVRERSVWGGTLVPFDSVWRAGANDATHLFTTRALAFGSLTLAPGMYTLWVQHTRNGTSLIVNKQTGQWGTVYDPAQDVGRVEMQVSAAPSFAETFTIAIRTVGPNRGVLDMTWADKTLSAPFTVSMAR